MRADAPQPGRGRDPGVPGEKVIRMDLLGSAASVASIDVRLNGVYLRDAWLGYVAYGTPAPGGKAGALSANRRGCPLRASFSRPPSRDASSSCRLALCFPTSNSRQATEAS